MTEARTGRAARFLKLGLAAVAVVALILLLRHYGGEYLGEALERVEGLGVWGPVYFILIYIACCVLFIPGSVITLAGGAIFGVVLGSVYASVGATLGATAAFLVGRYLLRQRVAKKIDGSEKFQAIDDAVAEEGWKIVFLARLSPIFPFNLLNYAFGLTKVSLRGYVIASWIGMIPGTVAFVYLGSLAGSVAAVEEGSTPTSTLTWAIRIVGFVATVVVTVFLTQVARKALARRIDERREETGEGPAGDEAGSLVS
jgi:uncharacterized membrane protein YdjX (TVP38/TMEM64 family)